MPRLLSIDLGAHTAKVTVYRQAGRRSELEGHYSAPVPQDGSEVAPLAARLAALDALLEDNPAWADPANQVGLVWPAETASVKVLKLPFTDRAQVDKTLPFTIEGEVPFDLDDMVFGWRPLSVDVETRALVTVAPRVVLSAALTALSERGLDPAATYVDGELAGTWTTAEHTVAVLDVGHAHTVLSVARGGLVFAVHAIDVGGLAFTRAIQEALGCTWAEAESLKHGGDGESDGRLDALPPAAQVAVQAAMGLLLAEVRSALIAVEDTHGVSIDHCLLTGGGGRLDPLASYLAEDLGLALHRVLDPDGVAVRSGFAANLAMVLTLSRSDGKDRFVQLRVGELAYHGGVNLLRAIVVYGTAAVAFFFVAMVAMFAVRYQGLSAEQSAIEKRIKDAVAESLPDVPRAAISNTTTAMAIMTEQTLAAQARASVLSEASDEPPTIDKLRRLTAAFPPHTEVTVEVIDLTITPATISFTAETDGYASAGRVEESLRADAAFKEAAKAGDKKAREKVSFNVTIPLDGPAEGEEG